jgi:hypothetical protein
MEVGLRWGLEMQPSDDHSNIILRFGKMTGNHLDLKRSNKLECRALDSDMHSVASLPIHEDALMNWPFLPVKESKYF